MRPATSSGVELLERALAYTRGALAGVGTTVASTPTPCTDWDLRRLLRHMDDGLAAFVEAATGQVAPAASVRGGRHDPDVELAGLVEHLRELGCSLMGRWSDGPGVLAADGVRVAGGALLPDVVAELGALEIAVHGWDVARACGLPHDLPPRLAAALLPVAARLIGPQDRGYHPGARFAPCRPALGTDPAALLLAYVGRTTSWRPVTRELGRVPQTS